MALFVVAIVGLVIAQTWLDWRDTRKNWVLPEWAKGVALAGIVAVSLTVATSFASVWIQESAGQWTSGIGAGLFWPQLGFLLCAMGIIIATLRKKRLRLMLILTALLTFVFWLGMTLSS
ncbi:MAG: hypothetical protein ACRD5M_08265 [Candidatus Acidiferrales bacterium]